MDRFHKTFFSPIEKLTANCFWQKKIAVQFHQFYTTHWAQNSISKKLIFLPNATYLPFAKCCLPFAQFVRQKKLLILCSRKRRERILMKLTQGV